MHLWIWANLPHALGLLNSVYIDIVSCHNGKKEATGSWWIEWVKPGVGASKNIEVLGRGIGPSVMSAVPREKAAKNADIC